MTLSHQNDDEGVVEAARYLVERYGTAAQRVAHEWADIKYQQGAPQTAAVWLRIAGRIGHLATV